MATALEALGAEAAARAQALAASTDAKARPRKQKALRDFYLALGAAGVSPRRAAVPAAERGVAAWFAQVLRSFPAVSPRTYLHARMLRVPMSRPVQ